MFAHRSPSPSPRDGVINQAPLPNAHYGGTRLHFYLEKLSPLFGVSYTTDVTGMKWLKKHNHVCPLPFRPSSTHFELRPLPFLYTFITESMFIEEEHLCVNKRTFFCVVGIVVAVIVFLTLTRIIKSVVTGQAPDTYHYLS